MISTDCLIAKPVGEVQALPDEIIAGGEVSFLFAQTPRQLDLRWLNQHPDILDFLVASIARQPKNLIMHVQRIALCYQKNQSEHLFGAMVDLFSVLDGHAEDFCGRLLDKVLPKLEASHALLLNQYLQEKDIATLHQVQNPFSVKGRGLLGTSQLVIKLVEQTVEDEGAQDAIAAARDYIEYSQFDEAKAVLGQAILVAPMRKELHVDLLELYKSLQDIRGFLETRAQLAELGNPHTGLWDELNDYFSVRQMI